MASLWSIPGLKQVRQSDVLNELFRIGYGRHWGCFETKAEAVAFLAGRPRADYDDDDIVQINLEAFKTVQAFDWPVMFFMERLIEGGFLRTVTDFGGHVGVKYYAYGAYLAYPEDLIWQVVDVPAVCRQGVGQRPAWASALSFHRTLGETVPCDLLLCSGSLQYADLSLPQVVAELAGFPRSVIVNKVALARSGGFFTLESFGRGRMPYRVLGENELDDIRDSLGYALQARWDIPDRNFEVHSRGGARRVSIVGEAWTRR
ncbi:methyltransferase, TIGR04325 family [Bosea sp. (in: a-proteobacteria)]|uniref:methyltransferase, TIGR04325 family n=1 Tax=Bosea sp. (in: a-proteobacteria) TaxID=1871050 RepID=UPI0026382C86|nr:methyltransferase, TIGR04325 family [Bosea sp. (in: a-proteobacteria)]MCO5090976.1 methyltransferase, TIGR04325 family [Bosea sp. (in: a-proteobacteria)]